MLVSSKVNVYEPIASGPSGWSFNIPVSVA